MAKATKRKRTCPECGAMIEDSSCQECGWGDGQEETGENFGEESEEQTSEEEEW